MIFLVLDTAQNLTSGVYPTLEDAQMCVRECHIAHFQIENEKGEIVDWSDDQCEA